MVVAPCPRLVAAMAEPRFDLEQETSALREEYYSVRNQSHSTHEGKVRLVPMHVATWTCVCLVLVCLCVCMCSKRRRRTPPPGFSSSMPACSHAAPTERRSGRPSNSSTSCSKSDSTGSWVGLLMRWVGWMYCHVLCVCVLCVLCVGTVQA